MKYFDELNQLVKDGKIKFTVLVSLPRSNSTAFELALQQAFEDDDIQLGSPWHSKKFDLDDNHEFDLGCQRIYDEVMKAINTPRKSPISILIKSHASHLETNEFARLLSLSNEFGFSYRDPYSQFQSMITRMGNDLVNPGGNGLRFSDALKELEKQGKLNDCLKVVVSHWQHLIAQYRMIKSLASKALFLQDGFTMRAFPEQSMQKACAVFHRKYTPQMISGWNNPTTKYTCMYTKNWGEARLTNAWNGPAVNSTEIKRVDPNERNPKDASIFPESCQEALKELMGYYRELATDALHQSYSPTEEELDGFKEVCSPYLEARVKPSSMLVYSSIHATKKGEDHLLNTLKHEHNTMKNSK